VTTDLLRLHGDELARGARDDLAVNVIAGGPPDWLRDAIAAALDDLGAYPDERAATAAVAARHGRDPAEVVLVNGAAQAFWLVAHGLPGHRPACVHPSFTEPEAALRAAGRRPERAVLPEPYALDPAAIPAGADLVVLGNPTNPTGALHPREAVEALARPGRIVVVDEAFIDLVPGEPGSLAGPDAPAGVVVIRSLTKSYAIPGLRAGYLLAPPSLAARLRDQRPGWSVNTLALAAIAACAARPEHAARAAAALARARADLHERLLALPGATVHPGAANFLLAHLPDGAARIARARARGVVVRSCHTFPGLTADHLRVTVRDRAAHRRLIDALT
jgi:histidinol-phosphate aminotransferase